MNPRVVSTPKKRNMPPLTTARSLCEHAARVAVVLATMKPTSVRPLRVEGSDVETACAIVFRAHVDTIAIVRDDDRTQEEIDRGDLQRFLRESGEPLHVTHGNASGLSVARIRALANMFPELFEVAPERTSRRGQPRKMLRLRG